MYHSISESDNPNFRANTVSPRAFAAQMDWLAQAGFTTLIVSEFVECIAGEFALPERAVVLTFDDGYADFVDNAYPILEKYNFTATLYIVAGMMGNAARWLLDEIEKRRALLNQAQLYRLTSLGFECGAHGFSHRCLDTLSLADARAEIYLSKQILEECLEQEITSFSYPYGFYTAAIRRKVQDAGFVSACSVEFAISSTQDRPFDLARIPINPDIQIDAFERLVIGEGLRVAPVQPRLPSQARSVLRRSLALWKRTFAITPGKTFA
jgi:peptidoglycan/xylan/chitin deacetylase (PgdA/CDA1 family)